MKIIATDADDERTENAQLSYSIVEQANTAGLFWMNSQTGELMVQSTSLDREVSPFTDLLGIVKIILHLYNYLMEKLATHKTVVKSVSVSRFCHRPQVRYSTTSYYKRNL